MMLTLKSVNPFLMAEASICAILNGFLSLGQRKIAVFLMYGCMKTYQGTSPPGT